MKNFENLNLEVVPFINEDVIATSTEQNFITNGTYEDSEWL